MCINDTLLWADSIEDGFFQAAKWLDTCGRNGITLNPEKFQFALDEVEFAGFEIVSNTVRPRHNRAITDLPTLEISLMYVRSWLALVNHVAHAFSMTKQMLPFGDLKPGTSFYWDDSLQQAFDQSKLTIPNEIASGYDLRENQTHMPSYRLV